MLQVLTALLFAACGKFEVGPPDYVRIREVDGSGSAFHFCYEDQFEGEVPRSLVRSSESGVPINFTADCNTPWSQPRFLIFPIYIFV